MTTREEWLALAEKCSKAKGPSFALDLGIGLAAGVGTSLAPPYTASLDAITGLVEAERPVMSYEVRRSGTGDKGQATIWNPACSPSAGYDIRVTGRPSPALRADGEGRAEVVARLIDHITLTRESAPAAENAP